MKNLSPGLSLEIYGTLTAPAHPGASPDRLDALAARGAISDASAAAAVRSEPQASGAYMEMPWKQPPTQAHPST
jgi:hypothetical protein